MLKPFGESTTLPRATKQIPGIQVFSAYQEKCSRYFLCLQGGKQKDDSQETLLLQSPCSFAKNYVQLQIVHISAFLYYSGLADLSEIPVSLPLEVALQNITDPSLRIYHPNHGNPFFIFHL